MTDLVSPSRPSSATYPALAVLAAVRSLDAAFNAGDLDGVLQHYEPDALLVVQPGVTVSGPDALRRVFPALMNLGSGVHVVESTVLASGDLALLLARWTIRRSQADGGVRDDVEVATSVLRRRADGRWRLVIDNAFGPRLLEAASAGG